MKQKTNLLIYFWLTTSLQQGNHYKHAKVFWNFNNRSYKLEISSLHIELIGLCWPLKFGIKFGVVQNKFWGTNYNVN